MKEGEDHACRGLLENGQRFSLFCQLAFEPGIFGSQFAFAHGGYQLLLLFAPRGIKLRFIETEFTCGCGHANTLSELKRFAMKGWRVFCGGGIHSSR
jgi:hypothetical protein